MQHARIIAKKAPSMIAMDGALSIVLFGALRPLADLSQLDHRCIPGELRVKFPLTARASRYAPGCRDA